MKSLIPYLMSVCLALAFSFSTTGVVFSQTDKENSADSTIRKNEEGSPYVSGLTSSRAKSLVGGVIGLLSVIIGWRVKRRSTVSPGSGRSWVITSLVMGIGAIVLSIIHLASTSGGFGTGGGKAGAIVALVLGFVGASFSGLALRSKAKE